MMGVSQFYDEIYVQKMESKSLGIDYSSNLLKWKMLLRK